MMGLTLWWVVGRLGVFWSCLVSLIIGNRRFWNKGLLTILAGWKGETLAMQRKLDGSWVVVVIGILSGGSREDGGGADVRNVTRSIEFQNGWKTSVDMLLLVWVANANKMLRCTLHVGNKKWSTC